MHPLRMPTHEENDLLCRGFGDLPTTPHTDSTDPMNNASGSFVTKLFAMVETEPDSVVTWIREGTAFCIVQPKVLAETFLPKYFRHGRFSSLIRQLNFYSFYKVTEGSAIIYQHSHFRQGRPDLLVHIKRRGAGKAKDPWIDPLSTKQRYPSEQDTPIYAPIHINNHSNTSTGVTAGDLCSSPSSKPLSTQNKQATMLIKTDNMSPALKPGTAQMMAPPAVDLNGGGRKEMPGMMKQRTHHMQSSTMFGVKENPSTGSLVAVRSLDQADMSMRPPLWRTSSSASINTKPADLMGFVPFEKKVKSEPMTSDQIKDEMIDDAILDNLTFGDMLEQHPPSSRDPRSMVLARNCLKGPAAVCSPSLSAIPSATHQHSSGSSLMMHNNSMLFDPADIHNDDDDDTWEVPLSPLNDPEDIPWLDLSF
ncbi:hypothetical protein B5M09_009872 [Aphanomyces astaci]|nr:hypothetical protein B5M09_009872 [Aphanomyces astaci]